MGIVNGTTNYILTKMSQEGAAYEDVLKEAQELGYAESDPTSDVEGLDAARKMTILGTLGFHVNVSLDDVEVKGISQVTKEEILYGKRLGYEVKLLGIAERKDDFISISVQPTMVKQSHPLAAVNGVFNAVYVYGEAVGETMFYGPGAGELPTATSVVADLVAVVKNLKLGVNGQRVPAPYKEKKLKTDEQIEYKYFVLLHVADKAGVLAQITQVFAEYEVSLESVLQQPNPNNPSAEIIIITHDASKSSMNNVLNHFAGLDVINTIKSVYRVEG
jgi:homoserine dehydrogenase